MQMAAAITCVAGYLPEDKLTNADLEKLVDTSDEWIRTRTGPTKETGGPGPDPTGPETKPVDPARTRPENFFSGSQTPECD